MANSPWCIKRARRKYKGWLCFPKSKLLSLKILTHSGVHIFSHDCADFRNSKTKSDLLQQKLQMQIAQVGPHTYFLTLGSTLGTGQMWKFKYQACMIAYFKKEKKKEKKRASNGVGELQYLIRQELLMLLQKTLAQPSTHPEWFPSTSDSSSTDSVPSSGPCGHCKHMVYIMTSRHTCTYT